MAEHHLNTNFLADQDPELAARIHRVFGSETDPMPLLERRARELLPEHRTIVWEGDAQTIQFTYVSESARDILDYACDRWLNEPTFWADVVVHAEDRDHAISFCALATGKCKDHDFEYRAVGPDGQVVWLHDVVRVIVGRRGVAERLRGVMVDVSDRKQAEEHRGALHTMHAA